MTTVAGAARSVCRPVSGSFGITGRVSGALGIVGAGSPNLGITGEGSITFGTVMTGAETQEQAHGLHPWP
jgi:hypothetical protein